MLRFQQASFRGFPGPQAETPCTSAPIAPNDTLIVTAHEPSPEASMLASGESGGGGRQPVRARTAIDWEAVAGIIAAVVALVLHLVHVADDAMLLSVILVVLALVLLRDLRRESREENLAAFVTDTVTMLREARLALPMPDAVLVGPAQLRATTEQFVGSASEDMIWFNVCLRMFVPPFSMCTSRPPWSTHV